MERKGIEPSTSALRSGQNASDIAVYRMDSRICWQLFCAFAADKIGRMCSLPLTKRLSFMFFRDSGCTDMCCKPGFE